MAKNAPDCPFFSGNQAQNRAKNAPDYPQNVAIRSKNSEICSRPFIHREWANEKEYLLFNYMK